MSSTRALLPFLLAGLASASVGAATPARPAGKAVPDSGTGQIYSCVDANGNRLSSDRPIPECAGRDQRLLNRDGTLRQTVPPLQSPEEKARTDAVRRAAEQQRLAREAEARRDRALMARYPDQATHDDARAKALEPALRQAGNARLRLAELEAEGLALAREREALAGKPAPAALRARIAANEGAIEAQQTILRDQEAERERLRQQYDLELTRLRALWAGAAPGRMGPLPTPAAHPGPAARGASGP